ncbi:methyltransferase [Thaumasiovibrio subtropicus]|uniref:methyltransferase n=1 Tax=Thaumasiovibrio subtropicus TaxID=1891207 RepID=UPI000B3599A6|nr:methyltransferase [Thaumasiovibrio subtropicus]
MFSTKTHFEALDKALVSSRQYWQFLPFERTGYFWEQTSPLVQWLEQLSDQDVVQLKSDLPALAEALSPFIPEADILCRLADDLQWPLTQEKVQQDAKRGLDAGIPGRKWHQINAFSRGFENLNLPFLEWCAGKAHLGRLLADLHQQSVTSLEWQASLCEQGEQQAQKHALPVTMVCGDAFSDEAGEYVKAHQHAVALHACGELHMRLLRVAAENNTEQVTISPCCYHLIPSKTYQPLSQVAQVSEITLSKHDLRLPLQETVTAPARIERLRATEMSFRLGFDLLQRDLRNRNAYMPIPNVKKQIFNQGFAYFCQWAADKKQIALQDDINYDDWLSKGQCRFKKVERMELVRQLFRRPLELWLILDRVLFMEQQGYRVSLQRFCEKSVTPRNFYLHAVKQ